ncbi:amino acid adenylation domain-containing protein [Pseudoalteromonas rhizosphaerae]|uniref:amino acid adenylation domain-containing protein n=1 Tax=Pseudoalteromonas rhizosphaerae TaxID=2518973 RepID=UPI0038516A1C
MYIAFTLPSAIDGILLKTRLLDYIEGSEYLLNEYQDQKVMMQCLDKLSVKLKNEIIPTNFEFECVFNVVNNGNCSEESLIIFAGINSGERLVSIVANQHKFDTVTVVKLANLLSSEFGDTDYVSFEVFKDWQSELKEEQNEKECQLFWEKTVQQYTQSNYFAYLAPRKVEVFNPNELSSQKNLDSRLTEAELLAGWAILMAKHGNEPTVSTCLQLDLRQSAPDESFGLGHYLKGIPLSIECLNDYTLIELVRAVEGKIESVTNVQESYDGIDTYTSSISIVNFDTAEQSIFNQVKTAPSTSISNVLKLEVVNGECSNIRMTWNSAEIDSLSLELLLEQLIEIYKRIKTLPLSRVRELTLVTQRQYQLSGTLDCVEKITFPNFLSELNVRCASQLALVEGEKSYTYEQLQEKASRLAKSFLDNGVQQSSKVIVLFDSQADTIVSMIACWYIGAVFVPIDFRSPLARNKVIVDTCSGAFLLAEAEKLDDFINCSDTLFLDFDTMESRKALLHESEYCCDIANEAYLIFTSGTTGTAKGARISHKQITNYVNGVIDGCKFEHGNYLLTASLSVDIGYTMVFASLVNYGTLHLLDRDTYSNVSLLGSYIEAQKIDFAKLTPSHLRLLLQEADLTFTLPSKMLMIGGESCPIELIDILKGMNPQTRLINHYGPTEATIGVAFAELSTAISWQGNSLPLNTAIGRTELYVANEQGDRLGAGLIGELHISGDSIFLGYLGTSENSHKQQSSVYKTGDLARIRANGELEIIGRMDNEIKIRGHRVNLLDIQHNIRVVPEVSDVFVDTYLTRESNTKQICAYIVPNDEEISPVTLYSELSTKLQSVMPEHFLPSVFIKVSNIPIGYNGKVDAKSLPDVISYLEELKTERSECELENEVQRIWSNVFEREVGYSDSFFKIGGYSILAIKLVNRLNNELKLSLVVKSLFSHPTISALCDYIKSKGLIADYEALDRKNKKGGGKHQLPLLYSQKRVFLTEKVLDVVGLYNQTRSFYINGYLDLAALHQALKYVASRHDVLRLTVRSVDNELVQVLHSKVDVPFLHIDIAQEYEQDSKLRKIYQHELHRDFLGEEQLMYRLVVIKLSESKHCLVLNTHHSISDAWSMGILIKELTEAYSQYAQSIEPTFPAMESNFFDIANEQQGQENQQLITQSLPYWLEHFEGSSETHALPLDNPRASISSSQCEQVVSFIGNNLYQRIKQESQIQGVTPFVYLKSAFALLLSRLSNTDDLNIGTIVSGREQLATENIMGFFAKTLAIRYKIDEEQSFTSFLQLCKERFLEGMTHTHVPFEMLVEKLNPSRERNLNPIFQILFLFQENMVDTTELEGFIVGTTDIESARSKFDLELIAKESKQAFNLTWTFKPELFNQHRIQALASHFEWLLEQCVERPNTPMCRLSLNNAALTQELKSLQSGELLKISTHTVIDMIKSWSQHTPNDIALCDETTKLTYSELHKRSLLIANHLLAQGVAQGDIVAVSVERNVDYFAVALGVMQARAVLLPIDVNLPSARKYEYISDSGAKIVVSEKEDCHDWNNDIAVISCSSLLSDYKGPRQLLTRPDVTELAYIIYTSGTTGKPKGVMIEHGGFMNTVNSQSKMLEVNKDSRCLQYSSISFDACAWEWGICFSAGAPLYIINEVDKLRNEGLASYIQQNAITHATLVPSVLNNYSLDDVTCLKVLVCAGDALSTKLAKTWVNRVKLVNAYGPSECAICATSGIITDGDDIHIGNAIANTTVYILDKHLNMQPKGTIGEIYVGGAGLARGYLNSPELTKERFITSRFDSAQRLYKTGDLGCYDAQGNIKFIGRVDEQVKLRGHRIELGEIEQKILTMPEVDAALVMLRSKSTENQQLVAYVVCKTENDNESFSTAILSSLAQQLPSYMVPSNVVVMPAFPLTVNGKIDKTALPHPVENSGRQFTSATTETQRVLVQIWAELLELEAWKISITDNFFSLGGHSLLAVRMTSRIRDKFDKELSIPLIFDLATIEALGQYLDVMLKSSHVNGVSVQPFSVRKSQGLSFSQQRLWFIDKLQGRSVEYNMPAVFEVQGAFESHKAKQALAKLMTRHEILRTVYSESVEGPVQTVLSNMPVPFSECSIAETEQSAIDDKIASITQYQFDLSKDAPLRVDYISLGQERGILAFNMHHIASDGWSMGVLVSEFATLYRSNSLDDKTSRLQYGDFVHWQRKHFVGDVLNKQLDYWQNQLADVPQVHSLPLSTPRSSVKNHRGAVVTSYIDGTTASNLESFAKSQGLTVFMLLQGAFSLVLSRHSYSHDIVMGTPVANRQYSELEDVIGFFVNTLVIRTNTDFDSLDDYFTHIKSVHLQAQANQDVPFEKLVEMCSVERNTQHSPLVQIMFSLNVDSGKTAQDLSLHNIQIKPLEDSSVRSKFDLEVSVVQHRASQAWSWVYDTELFSEDQIRQLCEHTNRILKLLTSGHCKKVSDLTLISHQASSNQISRLYSGDSVPLGTHFAHELVSQQAASNPSKVALIFEQTQMTYGELEIATNQLAHYLRLKGVGAEVMVGLCVERSLDMIVGLLGILKAGGAYVPLDPNYPSERLAYMVKDTNIQYLVCHESSKGAIPTNEFMYVVSLDDVAVQANLSEQPAGLPTRLANQTMSSLAYVIYTSGSTGKPKGVMIEQLGLINLWQSQTEVFGIDKDSTVFNFSSFSFDASVSEWLTSLLSGAKLLLSSSSKLTNVDLLEQELAKGSISHITLPPSVLEAIDIEKLSKVEKLILAGEATNIHQLEKLMSKTQVINAYGPTEATVCATVGLMTARSKIHIGKAIQNTAVYVLDRHMNVQPQGTIGEIYIGGVGLARGYLNRPELTDECFIEAPFQAGIRLYKTGDLGRYDNEGNLQFLGRLDDQIKLRGHRIELGEIEHKILSQPEIDSALVILQGKENQIQQLVAYVVSKSESTDDEIAESVLADLERKLPDYMVPSNVTVLTEFPLTVNGKIDKKALPQSHQCLRRAFVSPTNEAENDLVQIWSDLLRIDAPQISVTDNFFNLGGHSLLAVRLVNQLNANIQPSDCEITVLDVFQKPILQDLATKLSNNHIKAGQKDVFNSLANEDSLEEGQI